eukprot:1681230-Amphidinium_carterae.5
MLRLTNTSAVCWCNTPIGQCYTRNCWSEVAVCSNHCKRRVQQPRFLDYIVADFREAFGTRSSHLSAFHAQASGNMKLPLHPA